MRYVRCSKLHFLEVKTVRNTQALRLGGKTESNRLRRARRRHTALYKELMHINNAWVARENELRGVVNSQQALPCGYEHLDIEKSLHVDFDGTFPRGRPQPTATDATTVPFTTRQKVVHVADRIDRLYEDLIVTTLQAKNLKCPCICFFATLL